MLSMTEKPSTRSDNHKMLKLCQSCRDAGHTRAIVEEPLQPRARSGRLRESLLEIPDENVDDSVDAL